MSQDAEMIVTDAEPVTVMVQMSITVAGLDDARTFGRVLELAREAFKVRPKEVRAPRATKRQVEVERQAELERLRRAAEVERAWRNSDAGRAETRGRAEDRWCELLSDSAVEPAGGGKSETS